MEPTWQSPDAWQKDGSSISGVSSLKKGAWTTILKATETHNGTAKEVIIKSFTVPEEVLEDPARIAAEREKFLAAAKLQLSLTQTGARAWVKILRIAEDAKHPSFSMEKCGPSVQDLLDNKVQLSAKNLYELVLAVLQALGELFERQKRSHGNMKASDILSSLPGAHPLYKLADPTAKGENHSANDLYALGLVLYQLIEHREWDPLNLLTPSRNWSRFGPKRDRWVQFLNLLLNPNGCQEPLAEVRKEALRLKPGTVLRYVALVVTAFALICAGAVGYHLLINRVFPSAPQPTVAGGQASGTAVLQLDPEIKTAYDQAHQAYLDARTQWTALPNTARYDHTQSSTLARAARDLIPDPATLTTSASYSNAADAYRQAVAKMEAAITQRTAEETAGKEQDSTIFADLLKAQADFAQAKAAWDSAAAKFTPDRDHTRSKTLAQAALLAIPTAEPTPTDPAVAKITAGQYRAASANLGEALALVPQEEQSGLPQDAARAGFEQAKTAYQQTKDQWASAEKANSGTGGLDLTAARAAAEEGRTILPDQIVLTDADSYRAAADLYGKAGQKYQQALSLIEEQKKSATARQADIAAAVAAANQALQEKKYPEALAAYRKAADLGNPAAMHNVGLLYETGQGTPRDPAQAAQWYRKAADLQNTAAMLDLALLYENGRGVDRDYGQAAAWYRKAADAKNTDAMNHLGYFYENGWGVPQDYSQAMIWYRKAADLNDAASINNIGVLFDKGRGVKADPAEAMKWYKKAADLGSAAAMNDVGALYDAGRGVKVDYKAAMMWYQKAADLRFPAAMCNIGVLYDNGLGVPVDHVQAMAWFKKAAALNHGLAMFNIAFLYETGRGVPADIVQAVNWYRKAVKSDDENARQLAGQALDRLGIRINKN